MRWSLNLLEEDILPDRAVRFGIRRLLARRLEPEEPGHEEAWEERLRQLLQTFENGPIAIATEAANAHHYEVPASFFHRSATAGGKPFPVGATRVGGRHPRPEDLRSVARQQGSPPRRLEAHSTLREFNNSTNSLESLPSFTHGLPVASSNLQSEVQPLLRRERCVVAIVGFLRRPETVEDLDNAFHANSLSRRRSHYRPAGLGVRCTGPGHTARLSLWLPPRQ